MRRFEARFHQGHNHRNEYVVVGYVVWDSDRVDEPPRVESPAVIDGEYTAHPMLLTLRHMVRVTGSRTFERLASLSSKRWSFVDVTATRFD